MPRQKRYRVGNTSDWFRVRAATTANGTLATAFANTSVIDGVTLATGDRILLKNQTTATENGVYVVAASGAPARASDYAAGYNSSGTVIKVSAGTANAGESYMQYAEPGVVGTDALVYISHAAEV